MTMDNGQGNNSEEKKSENEKTERKKVPVLFIVIAAGLASLMILELIIVGGAIAIPKVIKLITGEDSKEAESDQYNLVASETSERKEEIKEISSAGEVVVLYEEEDIEEKKSEEEKYEEEKYEEEKYEEESVSENESEIIPPDEYYSFDGGYVDDYGPYMYQSGNLGKIVDAVMDEDYDLVKELMEDESFYTFAHLIYGNRRVIKTKVKYLNGSLGQVGLYVDGEEYYVVIGEFKNNERDGEYKVIRRYGPDNYFFGDVTYSEDKMDGYFHIIHEDKFAEGSAKNNYINGPVYVGDVSNPEEIKKSFTYEDGRMVNTEGDYNDAYDILVIRDSDTNYQANGRRILTDKVTPFDFAFNGTFDHIMETLTEEARNRE